MKMDIKKVLCGKQYFVFDNLENAKKNNKVSFIYTGFGDIRGYVISNRDLNKSMKNLNSCDLCNKHKPLKKTILMNIIHPQLYMCGNYHFAICKNCKKQILQENY